MRRRERRLSEAEAALWRHAMADVQPLLRRKRDDRPAEAPAPARPADTGEWQTEMPPAPRPMPLPMPPTLPALPRDLEHGAAPGLDRRTASRLRRGQVPVDGRLDLHGMTQDDAHGALNAFLAASQAMGRRCVLIITGKGLREDGRIGVLRQAVPRWLNMGGNRSRVLAFAYAHRKHGGEGALYVLLRKGP